MFYSKVLGPTLSEIVKDAVGQSPTEQLAVFEELALIRAAALPAVAMYDKLKENQSLPPEKKQEALLAAGQIMTAHLKEVISTAEAASRLLNAGKDKFSVHNLQFVVNQIVVAFGEVCGTEHQDLAEQLEAICRNHLKLVAQDPSAQGTELTPDQDVMDMDGTVPKYPAAYLPACNGKTNHQDHL